MISSSSAFWIPLFNSLQLGATYSTKCHGLCSRFPTIQLIFILFGDLVITHSRHFFNDIMSTKGTTTTRPRRKSVHPEATNDKGIAVLSRLPPHYTDDKLKPAPDTFDGGVYLVRLFSYVTLFVIGFPIAPLFVLVSMVAVKRRALHLYLVKYTRGVPVRAIDYSKFIWVLERIAKMSVFTNALYVVLASGYFEDSLLRRFDAGYWWGVRVVFFCAWQLLVLLIFTTFKRVFPEMPLEVEANANRERSLERD